MRTRIKNIVMHIGMVRLELTLEAEDHGLGIERRTVVKFDARAQMKRPGQTIRTLGPVAGHLWLNLQMVVQRD